MWQRLMDWLPDLAVGTIEIRDLASLLVGGLGVYLAHLAIKMGRENDKVTEKQVKILGRLEDLEGQQAKLAERQNEINETQYARWTEEQNRRLDLRLQGTEQNREWSNADAGYAPVIVTVRVKNGSDKTADGFFWEILIPRALQHRVRFLDLDRNEVPGRFHPLAPNDIYDRADGHYPHKLFGWSTVDVYKLSIDTQHASTAKFWIKWRISCEDGGVPKAGGHAKIWYTRVDDGPFATYATYHPDPNGDQDAEPDQILDQETGTTTPVDNAGQPS